MCGGNQWPLGEPCCGLRSREGPWKQKRPALRATQERQVSSLSLVQWQVAQTKAKSIEGRRTLALGVENPPTSALKFRVSGSGPVSRAKLGCQACRPPSMPG